MGRTELGSLPGLVLPPRAAESTPRAADGGSSETPARSESAVVAVALAVQAEAAAGTAAAAVAAEPQSAASAVRPATIAVPVGVELPAHAAAA